MDTERNRPPGEGRAASSALPDTRGAQLSTNARNGNLGSLQALAERIADEHEAAHAAARSAIEHAIQCGILLIEVKAQVPHGSWLAWLEENCTFSQRTAQGYIRLARELPRLDPEKAQRVAHLSLRDALGALGSQSAQMRKLPAARVQEVLSEAGEQAERPDRLRDALVRAVNAERRRAPVPTSEDRTWTRVALPPMQPTPPLDRDLGEAIAATIRERGRGLDVFVVLETLNSIYAHLQDHGRLQGYDPDPVADLERAFHRMEPAEQDEAALRLIDHRLQRTDLHENERSYLCGKRHNLLKHVFWALPPTEREAFTATVIDVALGRRNVASVDAAEREQLRQQIEMGGRA